MQVGDIILYVQVKVIYVLNDKPSSSSIKLCQCKTCILPNSIPRHHLLVVPRIRFTVKAQPQAQGRVTKPPNFNSKTIRPTPIILIYSPTHLPFLSHLYTCLSQFICLFYVPHFFLSFMLPLPNTHTSHSHFFPLQGRSSSQPLSQPTHP